jgi:hypothetical protein
VSRRVLVLIGAVAAFWLLVALPARHFGGGDDAVVQSALAALLCLVPATAVMIWADWAFGQSAEQQLYVVLGGGGVRLFFVLGVAFLLSEIAGLYRGQIGFWIWLGVFYLFTLALEIVLLLKMQPRKST